MPVCLKCGKEIEPGEDYCSECRASGDQSVERILAMAELNRYRPRRNRRQRWLTFSMLVLAVLLVSIAVGLLLSFPSGKKFTDRAQASVCRARLTDIDDAVVRFKDADGKYPPLGRIDADHPIVTDQYIDYPLKCPTTGRYYILDQDPENGVPYARCDSGLPGHI